MVTLMDISDGLALFQAVGGSTALLHRGAAAMKDFVARFGKDKLTEAQIRSLFVAAYPLEERIVYWVDLDSTVDAIDVTITLQNISPLTLEIRNGGSFDLEVTSMQGPRRRHVRTCALATGHIFLPFGSEGYEHKYLYRFLLPVVTRATPVLGLVNISGKLWLRETETLQKDDPGFGVHGPIVKDFRAAGYVVTRRLKVSPDKSLERLV